MQPLYDKLLVQVPKLHDDEIQVGGLTLYKDTSFDEEKYRCTRATVLASPLGRSSNNYLPQTKGGRRYTFADIQEDAMPTAADTVYVKWLALEQAAEIEPGIYSVGLENVVARPDGTGGFVGFAGYVLCEPIFPEVQDEAAPNQTVTASGIVLVSDVKNDYTEGDESNIKAEIPTRNGVAAIPGEGVVRYLGPPLRGQQNQLRPHDHVVFDKAVSGRNGYPLRVKLEGREFYAVRRDAIVAVRGPANVAA